MWINSLSLVLKIHKSSVFQIPSLFSSFLLSRVHFWPKKELNLYTLVAFLHFCCLTNSPKLLSNMDILLLSNLEILLIITIIGEFLAIEFLKDINLTTAFAPWLFLMFSIKSFAKLNIFSFARQCIMFPNSEFLSSTAIFINETWSTSISRVRTSFVPEVVVRIKSGSCEISLKKDVGFCFISLLVNCEVFNEPSNFLAMALMFS